MGIRIPGTIALDTVNFVQRPGHEFNKGTALGEDIKVKATFPHDTLRMTKTYFPTLTGTSQAQYLGNVVQPTLRKAAADVRICS